MQLDEQFLAALDKTQYLQRDRMLAYQRRLLDRLVRHAREQTGLYPEHLAPLFRADDSIDWRRWAEVPILTRDKAQAHTDAITARTLPEAVGEAVPTETTGSTGQSWRFQDTALHGRAIACANERFFRWHDVPADALAAVIIALSADAPSTDSARTKNWRPAYPDSRGSYLSTMVPHGDQLAWLKELQPDIIVTFPSNLEELVRIGRQTLHGLGPLRIVTFGEQLSDRGRASFRTTFGTEPLDFYGSAEAGFIAGTCPHSQKYHVSADLVLVELVDEDGSLVEPGEQGRVVVTPFYGYATPLIRYDLGDYAVMSVAQCDCGRTLPTMERILGRTRNVFRFPDGTSLWPSLLSQEVQPFVPHRQFQVVQTAPDHIEYRYVPLDNNTKIDLEGLTALVKSRLHPALTVTPVTVPSIEFSVKREDYIRLFDY